MRINPTRLLRALVAMAILLSAVVLGQLRWHFLPDGIFNHVIAAIVVLGVAGSIYISLSDDPDPDTATQEAAEDTPSE